MATRPGCITVLPPIRRLPSAYERLNAIQTLQILQKREKAKNFTFPLSPFTFYLLPFTFPLSQQLLPNCRTGDAYKIAASFDNEVIEILVLLCVSSTAR